MSSDSNWYSDESSVRAELQEFRTRAGGPPRITGYDELHEVFRGGQGVVYRAWQRSTRQRVAIKLPKEEPSRSPAALRRFEREIELAATLRHPHIVRVYDSGTT